MYILQLSEQVDDVSVTHDQNLSLDCLQTDGEITWRFKITTEVSDIHYYFIRLYYATVAHMCAHTYVFIYVCLEISGARGSVKNGEWCCFLFR